MASTTPNNPEAPNREDIIQTDIAIAEVEEELSALMEDDSNRLGGSDVAELLERLSNADSMAKNMETKIDIVLENLDNLLDMLNASDVTKDPTLESAESKGSVGDRAQDKPQSSVKETKDAS